MSGLASSVQVNISRATAAVPLLAFGVALILDSTVTFTGVRSYSSLTAVAGDSLVGGTSSPAYLAAAALFSQPVPPSTVLIGSRAALVAGVYTLTPTVANTTAYAVTVNNTTYTFTSSGSATAANIVTGLIALVNADSNCQMTASGSTTLVLTAKNAGQTNVVTALTNFSSVVNTTPKWGVADDINAANVINTNWYCLLLTSSSDIDNQEGALSVETQQKIFVGMTNTSGIQVAATTTDVASVLQAKSYKRTGLLFSGNLAAYPACAWAGVMLPKNPGAANWAYKTLAGVTPDAPTDSQTAAMDGKSVSYYLTRGGQNVTIGGRVAGNDYFDITQTIDWLTSQIQSNVFGQMINLDKIPLNDEGIAIIEAQVKAALQLGVKLKLLSSYTLTVPLAASLLSSDKAARVLKGITFVAVAAGAVNTTIINGTVTL